MCLVNPNDLVCMNDLESIVIILGIICVPLGLGYLGALGFFERKQQKLTEVAE